MDHADQFGGLNVDRVLLAERAAVYAHHEAEAFDLLGQLGQCEANILLELEVDQLPVLEVAEQQIARPLVLRQRVEVFQRLRPRGGQTAPAALLLDEQHRRPEQVDVAARVVELLDMPLVARDAAPLDIEDREEVVVERLRLALFVAIVGVLAGEIGGAGAEFVPGQAHACRLSVGAQLVRAITSREKSSISSRAPCGLCAASAR